MIALLLVTKNEEQMLRHNLAHHLEWGFDRIAVADNASTDGTPDICAALAGPVSYLRFEDFHQRQSLRHRMLHELVETSNHDVEWAAIADTDEFFYSATPLREILESVPPTVQAVNFDAKLFLPTGLDGHDGSVMQRRIHRVGHDDSPLHTSYKAGKTFYRASWLAALPIDHNCARHEHLCVEVPHEQYRHPEAIVHHYMIQDEDQFVEKVVRLAEWVPPPTGPIRALRWRLTPKSRRSLSGWFSPGKKEWWRAYQEGGVDGIREYYRREYLVPADRVEPLLESGDLVVDDVFARYARGRPALSAT